MSSPRQINHPLLSRPPTPAEWPEFTRLLMEIFEKLQARIDALEEGAS